MFNEIVIHDLHTPLRERLKQRKHVGPYRWRPAKPGDGRSFYVTDQFGRHERAEAALSGRSLPERREGFVCHEDGSFKLRLSVANSCLQGGYWHLRVINGYYYDAHESGYLQPMIAALPHGRGFLAGWRMTDADLAAVDTKTIYASDEVAAVQAHWLAESDAESMREAEEREAHES